MPHVFECHVNSAPLLPNTPMDHHPNGSRALPSSCVLQFDSQWVAHTQTKGISAAPLNPVRDRGVTAGGCGVRFSREKDRGVYSWDWENTIAAFLEAADGCGGTMTVVAVAGGAGWGTGRWWWGGRLGPLEAKEPQINIFLALYPLAAASCIRTKG